MLRKHQLLVILVAVQSCRCNTWTPTPHDSSLKFLTGVSQNMHSTALSTHHGWNGQWIKVRTFQHCFNSLELSEHLIKKQGHLRRSSLTYLRVIPKLYDFFLLWNVKEDICRTLGSKQHWLLMYGNWDNSSKYLLCVLQKKQSRELPLVAGCVVHTVKMHKILELTND